MAETSKRVGRPRIRPESEGAGDYVGFRAPRELKEKLAAAAAASGRSLSTEAQFRLERSFEREQLVADLLGQALALRYGAAFASILRDLATAMDRVGRHA